MTGGYGRPFSGSRARWAVTVESFPCLLLGRVAARRSISTLLAQGRITQEATQEHYYKSNRVAYNLMEEVLIN